MTSKPKVAREAAEQDFVRMCESRRIDLSEMTPEEKSDFKGIKEPIIEAIQDRTLTVSESGDPTFVASNNETFTFKQPTGATFIAMETHPDSKRISNLLEALADMAGRPSGDFSRLPAYDAKLCLKLGNLFLADR